MPASRHQRRRWFTSLSIATAAGLLLGPVPSAFAATVAPGAPGANATWDSGAKQGFASATGTASKVWYTLGNGVLNEVYYPQTDNPDVQGLQYIVTDSTNFTDLESTATSHAVSLPDQQSLTWQQVNTATNGKYTITKTYAADPARAVLLIQTTFQNLSAGPLKLYVHYDPSLNNSGMGDTGLSSGGQLLAGDGTVASALAASTGFTQTTNGYAGSSSDGSVQLASGHTLSALYDTASTAGNLVQTAQIPVNASASTTFTLALAFGSSQSAAAADASASLASGWTNVLSSFQTGWHNYLAGVLAPPASVTGSPQLLKEYDVSLMEMKADEDKTFIGAFVASPTVPWGDAQNANNCCSAGYHAVWARDQYEMATALLAAGDATSANDALNYLYGTQEHSDGSYPQNTRLNGTPVFGSLQMDEVADPIVLDWQLGRFGAADWAKAKLSADYLVAHGPYTPQERWEEAGGYSPATIAAEIDGLVCAADIATRNGDTASASTYLSTADNWRNNVDSWTYTTTGALTGGQYYERIDNDQNPNDGASLGIANGGGNWDERNVVDTSFLELVRLGVKSPTDFHITKSITTVDSTIMTATPEGNMWHRYNHDGYGETSTGGPYTGAGVGRLWPVFTGERGEYDVALGDMSAAQAALVTMAGSANQGYQIPEQVWDTSSAFGFTFGQPTGSATPLEWSLAQYVRLARGISAGRNVETPSVVSQRYLGSGGGITQTVNVTVPVNTDTTARTVYLAGNLSVLGEGQADWASNGIAMTRLDATHWTATITAASSATLQYKFTLGDWASVEKSQSCADVGNRSMNVTSGGVENDMVAAWGAPAACGSASVTFTVTVPPSTDGTGKKVYLTGNYSVLGSAMADWNPAAIAITRLDTTHWQVTVNGAPGAVFQYKYDLGSWANVEKGSGCTEVGNRTVTLPGAGSRGSVNDTVVNWLAVSPC